MERDFLIFPPFSLPLSIISYSLHFLSNFSFAFHFILSPLSHERKIFFFSLHFLSIFSFSRAFLILFLSPFPQFLFISSPVSPREDGRWHMFHSDETLFYPQDPRMNKKSNEETPKREEPTKLC